MPDCSRHLVESLRSGRAQYRVFTIAQPAAGAGFSFTVDSLGWLQVLAIRYAFLTDATVINRVPRIEYRDGDGNDLLRMPGWSVAAVIANMQAADQISLIRVTALDWVTLTDAQTVVAERMEDL